MHKSRGAFTRGSYERRSLRYKQPVRPPIKHRQPINSNRITPKRTSLDLELDLRSSEVKLSHLQEEINRLRELKRKMEEARENGECLFGPPREIFHMFYIIYSIDILNITEFIE